MLFRLTGRNVSESLGASSGTLTHQLTFSGEPAEAIMASYGSSMSLAMTKTESDAFELGDLVEVELRKVQE